MKRGVTLLELLVVIAIVGMITASISRSYVVALDYEQRLRASRDYSDRYHDFEDRLTELLQHAYVTPDTSDAASYFIGGDPTSDQTNVGNASSITFTVAGMRVPASYLNADPNDEFEDLNSTFGPQGGITEVGIGTTPVGDAGGESGLFIRTQTPADGDPTQGGNEQLLSDQIDTIRFQFYDGTTWQDQWDTRSGQRRLPSAIQVTYQFKDEDDQRTLVISLPLSDVTPTNPMTVEGSQ